MADPAVIEALRERMAAIAAGGEGACAPSRDDDGCSPRGAGTATSGPRPGPASSPAFDPESAHDALSKVVALVNASDKSELALRERLSRHGFSERAIEEALERARNCGIVDDGRYGTLLIESRLRQRHGSQGIERELARNGIDPSSVDGWPEAFPVSFDEELARALELLRAKPPRSKNQREGAYRKLSSRGFPASVASSAARIWCEGASL